SLIILDEIGRGTSTYDGVSIASACLEYIHNKIKARALFATHYHELTSLSNQLESLACYTMQIKEWQGKVIFLHKIIKGVADKSYGIHVAELAGLPRPVIQKAEVILKNLEQNHNHVVDLGINYSPETIHPLIEYLSRLNLDELTPKEALEKLYKLKEMI
ncbi:MAG: DNA mismatch repair protein MutS, partial [Pseudomonadota bacterium]